MSKLNAAFKRLRIQKPLEFRKRAAKYFDECDELKKMPTKSGLALAMGFTCTDYFERYRKLGAFTRSVDVVLTELSSYYEDALMGKTTQRGAEVWLKSQKGWTDRQEVKHSGGIEIKRVHFGSDDKHSK